MEFRTHLPRLTRTLELPDGAPSVVSCVVRRIAGYGCWQGEQVVAPHINPIRHRHSDLVCWGFPQSLLTPHYIYDFPGKLPLGMAFPLNAVSKGLLSSFFV